MPARKQKHKKKHQHHQQQQQQQPQQSRKSTSSTSTSSTTPETCEPPDPADATGNTQLPYKVENSSIVGRYLVASRDLQAGELIITEKPLAIGPCVSADAVCLGCYMPVQLSDTQYRCPACNWPMCGSNCRGLHQPTGHTKEECALLKAHNSGAQLTENCKIVVAKNLYELILVMRILLLKELDPERYAKIMVMESHVEMRKENAELWRHYQKNVVERLQHDWGMTQYSDDEIHQVCGILDVNCFEIGQKSAKARTLYPSAFLLAHDCSPNTSHTDEPETYAIVLRTSRKVRRDEAITLSYAYTLQGTLKRRDFMHAGKLFWCSCQRCADPTELGTDCSAIVCSKCKKGSVRSTDPLNQEADWKCDNCENTLSAKEIVKLLDQINNDLESIDVHDIPGLENFLKRYSQVLRPNHYLLLSAKYSLCQIYGRIEGYLLHNMSLADIKRKERYCRDFLKVIDVLEPGLTRLRGLIMYELHAPIMMLSQHLITNGLISKQDFQRNLKEVVKLLRESRDILKMEPVGSSEHEMGLAAADALNKMGVS